jgi:FAD/FMN-containing dehydrogenase
MAHLPAAALLAWTSVRANAFAMPSDTLLSALADLLGPRGFTTDPDIMAPWLTDWRGTTSGRAAALLSPGHAEEVQAVVRLAAAAGARLTVQGGNSGMCAGATPDAGGEALLLNLRRMNRIRSVDADAKLLTADAGVILADAHDAAAAVACRFPLTLGGKGSATLGGLVSTNAGGTQVLRHGTMRALTAGLEVVLPDGSMLNALSPLAKDNRGPDPKHLYIGGEGAFGIVTGVALHLSGAVRDRCVAWLAVPDPHVALTLLRQLDAQLGQALEGFEIMPEQAVADVLAHEPALRRPLTTPSSWHILVEAIAEDGDPDPSDVLMPALTAATDRNLICDAVVAASEAQANAMWHVRDGIAAAERAIGPALQHDVSVPVAQMPNFIDQVDALITGAFPGATTLNFGHLGDGNIHCHVRPPPTGDAHAWIAAHGKAASRAVYDLVTQLGGSISAEHGIGRAKRGLLAEIGDPAHIAILRGLKAALDPAGLLNPGVLIP